MGTLGGRFTTIDGLLTQLKSEFESTPFLHGDSTDNSQKGHVERVFKGIDKVHFVVFSFFVIYYLFYDVVMILTNNFLHHLLIWIQALAGEPFTIIIDDPLANSYIQNFYAPDDDPNLTIVDYDRTFDQNEELGLNDMKTENY